MVMDATPTILPPTSIPSLQALGTPALVTPKPSALQSESDTLDRPSKRRRILQSHTNTSLATPSPGPSSSHPVIDFDVLDAARRRSSARVMTLWESLAQRYARPLDEDDEIDILTGKIYKDRGVLRGTSEGWRIGAFGEKIEVEPIFAAGEAETETETGTSECDDEGEGRDTTGEADDAEEEDPFEASSYDWQYRQLPPPRPELSPQDAEDLKEFLEAERVAQEEKTRRNEDKTVLAEDEEDVVCLGDSLHDEDGALIDDDSDDEEFSSFAVDDTTLQGVKPEEDEDDEIEPISTILGALALGKTPQKVSANFPCVDNVGMTGAGKPNGSRDQNMGVKAGIPIIPVARNAFSALASTRPASEAGAEDELIVIDSDTDEEVDVDMDSPLKPKILPTASSSKPDTSSIQSPTVGSSNANIRSTTSSPTKGSLLKPSSPNSQSPPHASAQSKEMPPTRSSFSAMAASLQASSKTNTAKTGVPAPASVPYLSSPLTVMATMSQHVRSKEDAEINVVSVVLGDTISPAESALCSLGGPKLRTTTSTRTPKASKKTLVSSPTKPPAKSTSGKVEPNVIKSPFDGSSRAGFAKASESALAMGKNFKVASSQPARGDTLGATSESSAAAPHRAPKPALFRTRSPQQSICANSPTKSPNKPFVMEVVMTPSRRTPKAKSQSTKPSSSTATTGCLTDAPTRSEPAPTPEAKPAVQTPNSDKEKSSDNVNAADRVMRTRKRARESDGGVKTEESTIEPQKVLAEQRQVISPTHSCCPPAGQNQPTCCHDPSGFPQLSACPHGCSHPRQAHHCSGVHQHQHQHLHTHLPFPVPLGVPQFTANELTEAAIKLMYGFGAMHPAGREQTAWLPTGGTLPFGLPAMGYGQAGPSILTSNPKLERSNSWEEIPDSQERIPSSQEHERRKEELQKGKEKPPVVDRPVSYDMPVSPDFWPLSPRKEIQMHAAPPGPFYTQSGMNGISPTPRRHSLCLQDPKVPIPKRASSVIDIDSDSDDELAGFDAGVGSMRWEPPIKDEVDPDDNRVVLADLGDDLMSSARAPEGKARIGSRSKGGRSSPSKLRS